MIAAHEIAEEFFVNSRRLGDEQRAWLLARGVSDTAIESDPYTEFGSPPVRKRRLCRAIFRLRRHRR